MRVCTSRTRRFFRLVFGAAKPFCFIYHSNEDSYNIADLNWTKAYKAAKEQGVTRASVAPSYCKKKRPTAIPLPAAVRIAFGSQAFSPLPSTYTVYTHLRFYRENNSAICTTQQ